MKNLIYLLIFSFPFLSCGALRIYEVTEKSSRFERFHEVGRKKMRIDRAEEASKNICGGTLDIKSDLITFTVNPKKDGARGFYAMEPNDFFRAAELDSMGILQSFPEEEAEWVVYCKFIEIYIALGWYVLGEQEIEDGINAKKEEEDKKWEEFYSPPKAGTQ